MISDIFERFVEQTPLTVMVRAIMERIFATEQLEQLFEDTAERQYPRELLFSSVVGIMSLVVCGIYPSVGAAYKAFEKVVGVSKVSFYAKINGLEPKLSQALVRYSSEQLSSLGAEFTQAIKIVLPGYEVRIIDGNHIGGTEHRLKVLRAQASGALPGQAIAVLDPQREMVVDVFPEEDAHAQERSLLPLVLETVKAVLKDVHGAGKIESGLSDYYVVEEVQSTFRGMEIAIDAEDWRSFAQMSVVSLAEFLRDCANHVNLKRFLSSPRGAKKLTTKQKYDPKHPHVATFRLLTT